MKKNQRFKSPEKASLMDKVFNSRIKRGLQQMSSFHFHTCIVLKCKIFSHNDIVFKGRGRQKTCHWVPIGAMGPADICTALYPPRPSSGPRVRFMSICHITFMSNISCFFVFTVTHLAYCSNKVLYSHQFFFLSVNILWILYFGIDYRYRF